jgi:hypothetical protein
MGWIAAAVAVVGGVIQSQSDKSKQKKAQKATAEENQKASQWAAYREEQARKWELEDHQMNQNYKEDAVRSFAQFAPTDEVRNMKAPERTTVDTSGLANFNPNDLSLDITKRNQRPVTPAVGGAAGATQGGNGRALGQIR